MTAKVFNYAMHSFIFLIFMLYDNNLLLQIRNRNHLYVLTYFIFMFLEIYFWEIAGKNPGMISKESSFNLEQNNI